MSQYYRNHPDEPIRHDWIAGARRPTPCQPNLISAKFTLHLSECAQCKEQVENPHTLTYQEARQPLKLCEEGKRLLRLMFD